MHMLSRKDLNLDELETVPVSRNHTTVITANGEMGPKRSVQFSKRALRHMSIRERNGPSRGVIQHTSSHERSPYAPKFETRSQEETLKQERCRQRNGWKPFEENMRLRQDCLIHILNRTDDNGRCSALTELFMNRVSNINPRGWNFIQRFNSLINPKGKRICSAPNWK